MTATITVLYYAVGAAPEVRKVHNRLEDLQKLVGGYIEQVSMTNSVKLICNEEGRIHGLRPNRYTRATGDVIVGDFFVVAQRGSEYTSLTDSQIRTAKSMIGDVIA